ncbi:Reverse transcriptase, RNA-dependent DNA polymerase [Dillenia turbinata]|uniref:Reverse transcriptase, RNA-dependent DNA polymerase n=1 Tax=Dillenia turbinata TaxID=194707 RepID=A0AAN8UZB8_9MAGN
MVLEKLDYEAIEEEKWVFLSSAQMIDSNRRKVTESFLNNQGGLRLKLPSRFRLWYHSIARSCNSYWKFNNLGGDVGTQYRFGIYYYNEYQARLARESLQYLEKGGGKGLKQLQQRVAMIPLDATVNKPHDATDTGWLAAALSSAASSLAGTVSYPSIDAASSGARTNSCTEDTSDEVLSNGDRSVSSGVCKVGGKIATLKESLQQQFKLNDLGELKYFFGLEVAKSTEGIVVSQRKFALEMSEEAGFLASKPTSIPLTPSHKLMHSSE